MSMASPEGSSTQYFKDSGSNTMLLMALGPESLAIGYLDPLGSTASLFCSSRLRSLQTAQLPAGVRSRCSLNCEDRARLQATNILEAHSTAAMSGQQTSYSRALGFERPQIKRCWNPKTSLVGGYFGC